MPHCSLALRDRFRHAPGDSLAAIVAERGDREQSILRLKRDRFELRLFREQTRDFR